MSTMKAVWAKSGNVVEHVSGFQEFDGTEGALRDAAKMALASFEIVVDDESMVDGYRVLAEGHYDANEPAETPDEFASRLFAEARAAHEASN